MRTGSDHAMTTTRGHGRAVRCAALAALCALGGASAAQEGAPVGQEAPAAPAAPIRANVALTGELRKAVEATLAAPNYAFRCTNENRNPEGAEGRRDGGERGGSERGGARESREPVTIEGRWQAGSPTELKNGALVGFRLDNQLVYRRGEGANANWELFDEDAAISRRAEGGTAGGGAAGGGTAGGGTAGGGTASGGAMAAGGIPMTGLMMQRNLMQLSATRPPHELLARLLATGCASLEEVEVEGKKLWRATVDPRLADEFAGVDRLRRIGAQSGRGGGGGNTELAVTVELSIADGRVDAFSITTVVKLRRGDSTRITRYALTEFAAAAYEVPKTVLELLAT